MELRTNSGEAEIRIDAETGEVVRLDNDSKSDDGANQNRHNGNDDRDNMMMMINMMMINMMTMTGMMINTP